MASISKLPSGKFRALIRKKGREAISQTFTRKEDAKKWAAAEELKIEMTRATGKASVQKEQTFGHFISSYISWQDIVKPIGRSKRASLLATLETMGKIPMEKLNEKVIVDYAMGRLQGGAKGATIAVDLSAISSVLKWGSNIRGYEIDPEMTYGARRAVDQISSIDSDERSRVAKNSELQKIIREYESKKRGFIPMIDLINFGISSCMRQREICEIKIEDVDYEERAVIIRARKDPKDKERNDQLIPLFPEAWNIMIRHVSDRKKGRIFPFNSRSVSASFTRVTAKCSIDDLHFHDLRHTGITTLFRLGLSIEQVAVVSGHKDWKMLKRYTHLVPKDVHRAYNKLRVAREAGESAKQANIVT